MAIDEQKIQAILADYVRPEDIQRAIQEGRDQHLSVLEYLLDQHIVERDIVGQIWAEYFGIPYFDLNAHISSAEQRGKIPDEIAKKLRIVLVDESETNTIIATDLPEQSGLERALTELFPQANVISVAFSLTEDIDGVLSQYRKPLATRFSQIIQDQQQIAPEILDEIFADG